MRGTLIIICALVLFACSNTKQYEQIVGEWECSSWLNKSTRFERCDDNVYFKFNDNKTYTSIIASAVDSGTYKIVDKILHVSPEGKMEIAVQIIKSDSSSLEFLMNQAGTEEVLKLVRI